MSYVFLRDDEGVPVRSGDRIRFSYGMPPVVVEAKVTRRGEKLIASMPGHFPDKWPLRDLRRCVVEWIKVGEDLAPVMLNDKLTGQQKPEKGKAS